MQPPGVLGVYSTGRVFRQIPVESDNEMDLISHITCMCYVPCSSSGTLALNVANPESGVASFCCYSVCILIGLGGFVVGFLGGF